MGDPSFYSSFQSSAVDGRAWNSDAKYRTLFDSIDEGFCVIEVLFDAQSIAIDYVFVETSPSFHRQTGMAHAVGRSMRSLAPGHEEHWFRTYGSVAATGQPQRFEAPAQALGRWYDVYAFRVGEPWQNLVAVLFKDISDRKRLEQDIARSNQALREADLRKDRFIATLSHELRNPLAPLKVAAELLGRDELPAAQAGRAREIIRRQVDHMAHLLDDLLDVARITQGKLSLRYAPARLMDIIDSALETVRPLIENKRHQLELDISCGNVTLEIDAVRIIQVVCNLLNNAAKYTDPGGWIGLRVQVRDGMLLLEVQDTGIGIAPDQIPLLFEMFSQQQEAASRSEGGLGIGLALVKGIVELHAGSVEAASRGTGAGSRFSVRLPIRKPSPHQAPAPNARLARSRGKRILVADDNRDAADSLGMLLRQWGHEVHVEYAGQNAIARARAFEPHIVLLDLGMPQTDGFAVASALKQEAWASRLLLIATTGWGDAEARRKAAQAGFDHHLTKPVDLRQLEAVLVERGTG
jgi:signal transduction histidine kinase/CheY-like chemotaxis protein